MDYFNSENENPNIWNMDFKTFQKIKSLLDKKEIRERFLEHLPKEYFSLEDYDLMELESCQTNMSPGKWLLRHLDRLGGRVSDLIILFSEINLEQALIHLKEEEPLQIIEQPEPCINVNEGEKFCITCKASGYPHPVYQWFKDDEELLLEEKQYLLISPAKIEHSGTYVCKVSKTNADSSTSLLSFDPVTVVVQPCKSSNLFDLSRQNSEKKEPITIKKEMENTQPKLKECHEQNILSTKCPESKKIVIMKQPRSYGKVAQGSVLWFQCITMASQPVNYQWYRNNRALDGQTSFILLVDELYPDSETGSREFRFFCEVYNEYDKVISNFATVELSESDDQTKYVAEEKIAFLIANDIYEAYEEDLVTPAVDVADLAKKLKSIHFKVIVFRNLNLREMRNAFQAFCKLLKTDSYAVVFFAGHGFECYGQTYLQPIDCSENLLPVESMCAEYILEEIQKTKPALIVLLLDACRKRPLELGNATIELYNASMGNNTIYGYATCFLNGAYESDEGNSYFVKHLKKYITYDISIQETILRVQRDFAAERLTRNIQHPVIESSLSAARKLCDELRNPLDVTTNQHSSWLYQERNPIQKQTRVINTLKFGFIIEIKDHKDVYLNGVDVNLDIYVTEDANLNKLRKSGLLVTLNIPSLQVCTEFQFKNAEFKLGARNTIIEEEVLGLQKIQTAELKAQIILKLENENSPSRGESLDFSFTIDKIKNMNIFFS